MCRLFGFRSVLPARPHRSLVAATNALVEQSRRNPDGWGIGWFADDDAYVVKSATPAFSCPRFDRLSGQLSSDTFVVHVRRATVGAVDPVNAHPFRHGRWLFAHNGTVFGRERLRGWMAERTRPDLLRQIVGETDSEALFFYVLSRMAEAGVDPTGRRPPEALAAAGALRQALIPLDREAARAGIARPLTNVLLTDGRAFLGHRAGLPLHLATRKRACTERETCPVREKVCLEDRPSQGKVTHLLVATEPIGDDNRWEEIPDGATVVLDERFQASVLPPVAGWVAPERPAGVPSPA